MFKLRSLTPTPFSISCASPNSVSEEDGQEVTLLITMAGVANPIVKLGMKKLHLQFDNLSLIEVDKFREIFAIGPEMVGVMEDDMARAYGNCAISPDGIALSKDLQHMTGSVSFTLLLYEGGLL